MKVNSSDQLLSSCVLLYFYLSLFLLTAIVLWKAREKSLALISVIVLHRFLQKQCSLCCFDDVQGDK